MRQAEDSTDNNAGTTAAGANPYPLQLAAINRISAALFAKTDVDELLTETLEVSMQTTFAEGGSILLFDPEIEELVFRHVSGPVAGSLQGKSVPLTSTGHCATVFRTGVAQIASAGFDTSFDRATGFRTEMTLTTPIRTFDGPPIGVIQLVNKRPGPFDESDKELLALISALAATVLENARRAEIEKEAALARAEAEKQTSLTRILGFLGHQLKNQALILDMARQSFGPLLLEELAGMRESGVASAEIAEEYYREMDEMLNGATQKVIRQSKVINEYGERKDLFEFKPGDLRALLLEELAQMVEITRQHGGELDLSGLEPVPVFAFEGFFVAQAVFNLVNNALQAMREHNKGDRVSVRLACRPDGVFPDGNFVEIDVEDNGPGMPPHILQSILEGRSITTRQHGSGVGTRLVRDVVLTHGGELNAKSVAGEGTTFQLKLPIERAKPQ